jgi:hypothetical protein
MADDTTNPPPDGLPFDLDELRALEKRATPAPWVSWDSRGKPMCDCGRPFRHDETKPFPDCCPKTKPQPPGMHGVALGPHKMNYVFTAEDDALIAALRNYAPALLDAFDTERKARLEAEANYQFMVDRAADEKLDGYRELGARAAAAENERDTLLAQIAQLQESLNDCSSELAERVSNPLICAGWTPGLPPPEPDPCGTCEPCQQRKRAEAAEAKAEELRELLREALPLLAEHAVRTTMCVDDRGDLCARIDAELSKGGTKKEEGK